MEPDTKKLLFERLDQNLKYHAETVEYTDIDSIYELQKLAALHYYLKEAHPFTREEVEELLVFADPLEVVRECMDENRSMHTFPISKLLQEVDAYRRFKHYDEAEPLPDKHTLLMKALGQEYYAYRENLFTLESAVLFDRAGEITAMQEAYRYLAAKANLKASALDNLLSLEKPLKFVADRWPMPAADFIDMDAAVMYEIEGIKDSPEYLSQKQPVSLKERLQKAAQEVREQPGVEKKQQGSDAR